MFLKKESMYGVGALRGAKSHFWARKKKPGGDASGGPGATNRLLTATNDLSSILGVWRAHHVWCGHMRERELVGARYGVGLLTEY
jgi:hypothetical protein